MGTNEYEGVQRLREVSDIVKKINETYPDAKKLHVDIWFEWAESEFYSDGAELCPVVKIDIET